ncbi:hypothetical protein KAI87_04495, partial [Myxococcota bacterium]|nr:hypothetical protein [Myxococcota bacterium]
MTKSKKTTDLPITDTNTDTMTSLEPFLQKLGDILVNNDAQAVWCSSQGFMMERDGVMTPVSLDTGADDIVDLIGQVEEPFLTPEGILIERFGDSLVARSSNLLPKGLDSAVEKGWLSSLAAKFLDASAGLGRNILVAGPAWAAQALAWQLAHKEGAAVFSANPIAVPPGFVAVPELDAHARHHFTRLLAITKMDELVSLMTQNSSVIAVADATTLEKALLRYEAAVERVYPSASGPLQVLAGIDLVVVLGAQSEPRVKAIAEIRMAAEGYMPHLLFTTGVEPAPGALVPVAQPSWLDDFLAAGHAVLAGDLQSLAPASAPRPA